MASWCHDTRKGKRYVHVNAFSENGKTRPLPRKEVAHLDGKSETEIQAWVDWYTKNYEEPNRSLIK